MITEHQMALITSPPCCRCLSNACQNNATCSQWVDGYGCACSAGFEGSHCEEEIVECASYPCHNGAACVDMVAAYSCTCRAGFSGANCGGDVDECVAGPCLNGATCSESGRDGSIAPDHFACLCAAGFASSNCTVDVDECHSTPCLHGSTCTESSVDSRVSPAAYSCSCAEGFANGWCIYPFMFSHYLFECRVFEGGHCDIDVDECASAPCRNEATCRESSVDPSVPFHAYACSCTPGYANGLCVYDFIAEYRSVCEVATGGRCDIDVDECISSPCQNGAACAEEAAAADAYRCTCVAGYANGWCEYENLPQYESACALQTGGDCGVDVDECSSSPCRNGAACSDSSTSPSTSLHAYTCTCLEGFADGLCNYQFVLEYAQQCSRVEGGDCGIDVDECVSGPCANGATCVSSNQDGTVAAAVYTCRCLPGFEDYNCDRNVDECRYNPCANGGTCSDQVAAYSCACMAGYAGTDCQTDVDECRLGGCRNGATCTDSVDNFACSCVSGFDGDLCGGDVDECLSRPCRNGGACSDSSRTRNIGQDAYMCGCVVGYAGHNCAEDIDECASAPCANGAPCFDGVDLYRCGEELKLQMTLETSLQDWDVTLESQLLSDGEGARTNTGCPPT